MYLETIISHILKVASGYFFSLPLLKAGAIIENSILSLSFMSCPETFIYPDPILFNNCNFDYQNSCEDKYNINRAQASYHELWRATAKPCPSAEIIL